jgi:tetratricopeptide (TPR) repeat protein
MLNLRRRTIGVCVAILLSSVPFAFAGEAQWIEVSSPHFSVVTDAGEKRGRETVLKFEQMRSAFGAMLAKVNINLPIPLQIVGFRNTKEFRQFAPLWHGKPTKLAGLFQSGGDRDFILLDMSVEDPWTVVFHEYAHELMNGNLDEQSQPWFEEGYAEFFSTVVVEGKQIKLEYKAPPGDAEVLQQYGFMKISDLFRVQHNSQTYNEGDRRSVFYAESWLVVHYLFNTRQILKVGDYFDAIDQKLSVEDAIQRAFGMSAAQFDKTLHNYFSGQMRYFILPMAAPPETTAYTISAMSPANAKAVMADVHLHSLDYQDKAVTEFQEVLAAEPKNALALRGLGFAALRKRDFEKAGDYFGKAVQGNSKDPRVYYYSALLLNEENSMTHDAEKLDRMKKDLQESIALDPGFADSHALLAYAHMASGERDEALASMQRAVQLNPRNEHYLFNLSQMYLAMGKVKEATTVLGALARSANQEVAARARESIEQMAKMEVVLHAAQSPTSGVTVAGPRPETPAKLEVAEKEEVQQIAPAVPAKFLKGRLVSVDCTQAPAAFLTVVSGADTLKMKIADIQHAIVIGADEFSCAWTQKKVAVNYRESTNGELNVMTVEIQ